MIIFILIVILLAVLLLAVLLLLKPFQSYFLAELEPKLSESFTNCFPVSKKKEETLIRDVGKSNKNLQEILEKLRDSPFPFTWDQIFSKEEIINSPTIQSESDIQDYDWTFIKDIVINLITNQYSNGSNELCKLPSSYNGLDTVSPVLQGYEQDAKFVEIFSKSNENVVLLDTNFKLLDSMESNTEIVSKTYKDEQVSGNTFDGSYDIIDEEIDVSKHYFYKPYNYKCQRFYHNCQEKVRISDTDGKLLLPLYPGIRV